MSTTTAVAPARGRTTLLAYLAMALAGIAWGATFSLQKIVMASPLANPVGVTVWQGVVGLVIGVLAALVLRHWPRADWRTARFLVLLALAGTTIPNMLLYLAAPRLPAGVLAISVTTVPMMTYALAMAFSIERLAIRRAAGLALGLVAVLFVLLPESSLPESGQALWLLPALGASACFAVEAIYVAFERPPDTPGIVLVGFAQGVSSLMLFPVAWATDTLMPVSWPLEHYAAAMFLMAAVSITAYGLYVFMVSAAGAVFASQVGYVVTLTGVGWGMALFGERHSVWVWGAIALLLAGVFLVQPRARAAA